MRITFVWFDLGCTLLYQTREGPYREVLAELADTPIISHVGEVAAWLESQPGRRRESPGRRAP